MKKIFLIACIGGYIYSEYKKFEIVKNLQNKNNALKNINDSIIDDNAIYKRYLRIINQKLEIEKRKVFELTGGKKVVVKPNGIELLHKNIKNEG